MHLIELPMAGGGGRKAFVNPEQVVCLIEDGDRRTQLVTTGLSSESSISLIVNLPASELASLIERKEALQPAA